MPVSIYALTAKELAPDICTLLQMYKEEKLHEAVVRQVIKGACWWISNAQGRRDSCDLWSEKALAERKATSSWNTLGLIHDHIVPRKYIENCLMQLEKLNAPNVERLLSLSRVCIVTPTEDEQLRKHGYRDQPITKDCDELDIEGRYRIAGIQIAKEPFMPKNG